MKETDTELISRINKLWRPIYPYLAQWIGQGCPQPPQRILELGPFSGGITGSLIIQLEDVRAMCLMPQRGIARNIREQFASKIQTLVGSLERLPFVACFDLAIFRGAFFFLTPRMIRETYRILKPPGRALMGGGYGPLTPIEEIAKIAEESKRLNCQLGKKWISRGELEGMIRDADMEKQSEILEEGGLWLLLKKR